MCQFTIFLLGAFTIILILTLAFTQTRAPTVANSQAQPGTPGRPDTPGIPPLADKASSAVLDLFEDFYKQEIAAEEDVHRTLPFFATALGLIITALNYVGAQLPDWRTVLNFYAADHTTFSWDLLLGSWPASLSAACLILSALAIVRVLWLLRKATIPRDYERVGPEREYLNRLYALRDYHTSLGLTGDALDLAVTLDARDQLLKDLAVIIPHNRGLSLGRYNSRAKAFKNLLGSLFLALLATIIILITAKVGLLPAKPP